MGKHRSLPNAIINRLDQQMRIGESRHLAKRRIRAAAKQAGQTIPWSVPTGGIYSYGTRATYQPITLRFGDWVRETTPIRRLEDLDVQADELATRYLRERLAEGLAAHSLHTIRAALRQFFGSRTLASAVELPARKRVEITRSRRPVKRDRSINRSHWRRLIRVCRATGLRASEVRDLRVRDVVRGADGRWTVHVRRGKGGKERTVAYVLTPPDCPNSVTLTLEEARATLVAPGTGADEWLDELLATCQPDDHVIARIPDALDVQAERRWYAQTLYRALSGRELPPALERLRPQDYDRDAALIVSRQLGHNRMDVSLRNYLR